MAKVYLGLGSNMHNPPTQLETAVAALRLLPITRVLRLSPLYKSRALGKTDQPDFLNMVVEIDTELQPGPLLKQVKQIEAAQGRTPGEHWGPRPVDVDILLYGDRKVDTPTLVIPHPRMWERAFVLRPLADLAPDLLAPDGTLITKLLEHEEIASQGVWLLRRKTPTTQLASQTVSRK
jgi:2-amino-4-hydroxy-6-hydroxymethyldihydropteridine diphosphokinase